MRFWKRSNFARPFDVGRRRTCDFFFFSSERLVSDKRVKQFYFYFLTVAPRAALFRRGGKRRFVFETETRENVIPIATSVRCCVWIPRLSRRPDYRFVVIFTIRQYTRTTRNHVVSCCRLKKIEPQKLSFLKKRHLNVSSALDQTFLIFF